LTVTSGRFSLCIEDYTSGFFHTFFCSQLPTLRISTVMTKEGRGTCPRILPRTSALVAFEDRPRTALLTALQTDVTETHIRDGLHHRLRRFPPGAWTRVYRPGVAVPVSRRRVARPSLLVVRPGWHIHTPSNAHPLTFPVPDPPLPVHQRRKSARPSPRDAHISPAPRSGASPPN
jgi:hypothetical protein